MKTTKLYGILLAGIAGLSFSSSANAEDQQQDKDVANWRLSIGTSYSTGKYGETEKTEVISVPVALRYRKDNFSIRVSVPWVRLDGPGSLISTPEGLDNSGSGSGSSNSGSNSGSGSGNSGSGSSSSGSGSGGSGSSGSGSGGSGSSGSGSVGVNVANNVQQKVSGIGDVVVAATYSFELGNDFFLDVTGKAKLPTGARSKRLGTGKFDFTAGADLVKDIGNFSLYAGARHTFRGSSAAQPLKDTWGAGGGVSYNADGTLLGVDYDWQESAFAGRKASQDVTGWVNLKLADPLRLNLYAGTGLNNNSADFLGGATLSFRF